MTKSISKRLVDSCLPLLHLCYLSGLSETAVSNSIKSSCLDYYYSRNGYPVPFDNPKEIDL